MTLGGANVCGFLIAIGGIMSFLLNIFMIVLFVSNGLVGSKHSNALIYRLMLNFLISETAQIIPTIYIGLCAALQQSFLSLDLEIALGTLNYWMWFQMQIMLMAMAINRVVGVCYFQVYDKVFTGRNIYGFILFGWIFTGTSTVVKQFVMPCCAMITSFQIFTFRYYNPNNEVNYSVKYNVPTEFICIAILFICYAKVLWTLRKRAQEVASSLTQAAQRARSRQNVRFAIQFIFISLFFVLVLGFYCVLPKVTPPGVLLPYSAIGFCLVANCSINSITYLLLNPEIRRLAKHMVSCGRWTSAYGSETPSRRTLVRSNPQERLDRINQP